MGLSEACSPRHDGSGRRLWSAALNMDSTAQRREREKERERETRERSDSDHAAGLCRVAFRRFSSTLAASAASI